MGYWGSFSRVTLMAGKRMMRYSCCARFAVNAGHEFSGWQACVIWRQPEGRVWLASHAPPIILKPVLVFFGGLFNFTSYLEYSSDFPAAITLSWPLQFSMWCGTLRSDINFVSSSFPSRTTPNFQVKQLCYRAVLHDKRHESVRVPLSVLPFGVPVWLVL